MNVSRENPEHPLRTMAWFLLPWLALHVTAEVTGSTRGEWGLLVCAVVIATAFVVERALSSASPRRVFAALGFVWPRRRATIATALLIAVLACFLPIFSMATGAQLTPQQGVVWSSLGIFAQGGIAEEVVFRSFLFRRLRVGRTFWRTAALASGPFVLVHLLLFQSLDWPLALAALVLSVSVSFPLAWLFERAGNAVWLAALLHAVVQGVPKLIAASAQPMAFGLSWVALTAVAPWLLFFERDAKTNPHEPTR